MPGPDVADGDANFHAVVERVDRSLVAVLSGDYGSDGLERLDIGSGVLVRLGGREFVFTAAHNVMVDGEPKLEPWITVVGVHGLPGGLQTVGGLGGGALGVYVAGQPDARGLVEPDVAVVEPGPYALLRSDRAPITAAEIGFIPPDTPAKVLVAGYPRSAAKAAGPTVVAEGFGPHLDLSAQWYVASADLAVGHRHPKEPAQGRGLHVAWGGSGRDLVSGSMTDYPQPEGLSGGPVMAWTSHGPRLAGLVRSRDGDDLWCEHAMTAVAILGRHPDPAVSGEAMQLVRQWGQRWASSCLLG